MIASLRGRVLDVSLTGAVIETGGIGMAFQATPATLSGLRTGEEGFVLTELVVREDSMTLFGFADADERHCFRVLLSAKGVGAKLALAVLAVHAPDALRRAVASRDVAALTRVPVWAPKGRSASSSTLATGWARPPPTSSPSPRPGAGRRGRGASRIRTSSPP